MAGLSGGIGFGKYFGCLFLYSIAIIFQHSQKRRRLGPAIAFLYSGLAINILAIILTWNILGAELGIARTIGAVVFSVVIGIAMHLIYLKEERKKAEEQLNFPDPAETRPLWQTAWHFFTLVAILVFTNWGKPEGESGAFFWLWARSGGSLVFLAFC